MSYSDTDRLNFIINNYCDIEAPTNGQDNTWIVYDPLTDLGIGVDYSGDLRKAIDKAIECKNNN